jgi:hypothetical protein
VIVPSRLAGGAPWVHGSLDGYCDVACCGPAQCLKCVDIIPVKHLPRRCCHDTPVDQGGLLLYIGPEPVSNRTWCGALAIRYGGGESGLGARVPRDGSAPMTWPSSSGSITALRQRLPVGACSVCSELRLTARLVIDTQREATLVVLPASSMASHQQHVRKRGVW